MSRASDPDSDPTDLARYVRQRRELGESQWMFDARSGNDMLERIHAGMRRWQAETAGGDSAAAMPRSRIDASSTSAGPEPERPMRSGPADALPTEALPLEYDALRETALGCTRCRLCEGRQQVVFSDGIPDARVMVVGEAPGANEDRTGLPFVGAAGKLLDLLLASVGLSRQASVYICNVIKCRPPGNRNPRPDEIEACAPYLHRQIELVQPEVILAVGTFAGQLLSGSDRPLGKLRGEVHTFRGTPLVVTYHPAALLRNPGWTRPTWDDLQLLRSVLDER